MQARENGDLSDREVDPDDLFASPSRTKKKPAQVKSTALHNQDPPTPNPRDHPLDSVLDSEEGREAALRRELAGIRSINEVIEGVVESLERAKGNMEVSRILILVCLDL
jgi:hypothetical protein